MAAPTSLPGGPHGGRSGPDGADRGDPPDEPGHLWIAPGARRAAPGRAHPGRAETGGAAHAKRRDLPRVSPPGPGRTRRDPAATPSGDLVNRSFDPAGPDRLWCMDVTEHPTTEGRVYLAVVLDAFPRRVVGWSVADHIRSELVVDALQMALWRRQPPAGQTVAHSDYAEVFVKPRKRGLACAGRAA